MIDANGRPQIADFGVSTIFDGEDVVHKTEGTYHFLAPECCNRKDLQCLLFQLIRGASAEGGWTFGLWGSRYTA